MQINDIVRIQNAGEVRWSDKFNNQRFVVDPGKEAVVPFAALCLWMGNPDAKNLPGQQQHRRLEYNRMIVRYGAGENPEEETKFFPKLKAFDFDGNEIVTVVDDPEGKGIHNASSTVEEKELLASKVEQLTKQLASMRSKMDNGNSDEIVDEDISEDNPSKIPTGNSRVSVPD